MKKIAFVAAALLPLTFAVATPSFAATKKANVCADKSLSAGDQKACKSAMSAAKGKTAKAQVRTEYQSKIDAHKH